jgi:hypothetical protein
LGGFDVSTDLSITTPGVDADTVARVLLRGDLKQLTAAQKVSFYRAVCESVGLNPLTQPFDYLVLNGRECLYAKREATEQLRRLHNVTLTIASRELVGECYIVTARATMPDGRSDESIGAKSIDGLKGEQRANAMMTAETKAKRRVTLSICGLGMLDETEVADIPPAAKGSPAMRAEIAAALDPDPVDEAPAPAGFVRVQLVESTPTKNPNVLKFTITLSSGEVVTTINNWLASIAQDALEKRTPVKVETKPTKWGTDLVSLKAAADPERQPELPPLTADDIPF